MAGNSGLRVLDGCGERRKLFGMKATLLLIVAVALVGGCDNKQKESLPLNGFQELMIWLM